MPSIRHTLEWSSGGHPYQLSSSDESASLLTPDGQVLELTLEAWSDLQTALNAIVPKSKASKARREGPANAGKPWSADDDLKLAAGWAGTKNLLHLAMAFERSRGAIQARLERLDLI